MKIFVTGASGFVGREVCRIARQRGHEVLALCREGQAPPPGCKVAAGLLEEMPWGELERFQPEAALHLGWSLSPESVSSAEAQKAMVGHCHRLFEGLAARGVRHIGATGSGIEYAPSPGPTAEEAPLGPVGAYALAKVETCHRLQAVAQQAGLCWTWYRIFYLYGKNQQPARFVPWLIRNLSAGEAVELRNASSVKDYINVEDVATALLLSLEMKASGIYNVGSGQGIMLRDLAAMVADSLGADPRLVRESVPQMVDPIPVNIANVTKLQALGWMPSHSLQEGIRTLSRDASLPGLHFSSLPASAGD